MTNANTSRSTAQHDTMNSTASTDENDDKENPADANRLRPTTRSMTASTQIDVFGNVKSISPPRQKKRI